MARSLQQENEHWQDIMNETDPVVQKKRLITMADLILTHAELDEESVKRLKDEIPLEFSRLMLKYKSIGQKSEEFFDVSLPYVIQEFKEKPFEEVLSNLQGKLKKRQNETDGLLKNYASLLKAKIHLEQKNSALKQLKHNIKRLKKLKEKQSPAKVDALVRKAGRFNKEFVTGSMDVLDEIVAKLSENQKILDQHFAADDGIQQAMQENSELIPEDDRGPKESGLKRLAARSLEISDALEAFDADLAEIVVARERIQNTIRDRQQKTTKIDK
ncbi:MAG: hypothetical protein GY866_02070 [Proteobacteria bacterium]|nr:hypothetical protein [Pseudomonadota bacterium]